MTLLFAALAAVLQVIPWTGPPAASPDEAQYRLTIVARAGSSVHLEAAQVTSGWIGAFCTAKTCSPSRVDIAVPQSGRSIVRFDLIRTRQGASRSGSATIVMPGGARHFVMTTLTGH